MRSEQEILDLILETARRDERVRAVILNGSRANPNARRDFFQDFDVVYVVTEVASFKRDTEWINCFGERMILQLPDDMSSPPPGEGDAYAYLMQFTDGNRIDLTLFPLAKLAELGEDSLSVCLFDKDGLMRPFPPANERDCLPKPPTAKEFGDCCNEFWWVSPYVAKGLWREELPYARYMLDEIVREQLARMLTWYIGVQTHFLKSPGKFGKYFQRYLTPELWEMFQNIYADASYEHTWNALFGMGSLFRLCAVYVAEYFGYDYPFGEDARVSAHLKHVRGLPKNAQTMY